MEKLELTVNSVELWAKEAEKVFKASTREMTLNEADAFTFALLNEEAWGRDLRIKKALEEKNSKCHIRVSFGTV